MAMMADDDYDGDGGGDDFGDSDGDGDGNAQAEAGADAIAVADSDDDGCQSWLQDSNAPHDRCNYKDHHDGGHHGVTMAKTNHTQSDLRPWLQDHPNRPHRPRPWYGEIL